MTAAVTDHKPDLNNTVRCRRVGHVQVDLHAARAVGIDIVGAGLLPFRRKIGLAPRSKGVAIVVTLCESAVAVEYLYPGYNGGWTVRKTRWCIRRNAKRVFAFQRRVGAAEIFGAARPSRTADRRKSNRGQ